MRPTLLKDLAFMMLAARESRRSGLDDSVLHLHGDVSLARHHVNTAHFVHSAYLAMNARYSFGLNPYHVAYHRLHARLERVVFTRCSGSLVAVSGKVQHDLTTRAGVRAGAIRVIHNGTDPVAPMPRNDARRRIEEEFGFDSRAQILLFAGELQRRHKGLGTLLAALERLHSRRDLRLLVAGDPTRSPFPDEAARRGLGSNVVFCGFRRDLPALLAGVDAFVLPALYDSFPGVILEALAAGTAVVTSPPDYCGAAEVMVLGESGIWPHDPTDARELADVLARVLDDPAFRRALGDAGRAVARGLTWERMCDQYEELYGTVK